MSRKETEEEDGPPTLGWVKDRLQCFIVRHEKSTDHAALILDALKTLGTLIVKEGGTEKEAVPPAWQVQETRKPRKEPA